MKCERVPARLSAIAHTGYQADQLLGMRREDPTTVRTRVQDGRGCDILERRHQDEQGGRVPGPAGCEARGTGRASRSDDSRSR